MPTMTPYGCVICHEWIVKESHGGDHPSPGDHDPAYHVARAYHVRTEAGACWSCGESFPCPTRRDYA